MPFQPQGFSGVVPEVDTTFRASRVTIRPVEMLGYYSIAGASGALTGVAANGPVFAFRNTGANLLLVRRISIGFVTTTAFTTAQGLSYSLIKATGFTASDTGGTSIFTAGQNKHRTSFANIVSAPDIRISSTAALTAGTRTLETNSMGIVGGSSTAVGTGMGRTDVLEQDTGDYPLILAQNEGFVLTNLIAMGAAGVIQLQVNLEFAEATAY